MKVVFKKDALRQALGQVSKIANTYKTKKEYENIKLEAVNNGVICEMGNDQSFLHLEIEGNIKEEGLICFNALDFINIATRLSGDSIGVETIDNNTVIDDGISKIKLGNIKPELFIARAGLVDKEPLVNIAIGGKQLNKAANICLPFEDTPQYIPGINLNLQKNKKLRLCCCSEAAAGIVFVEPTSIEGGDTMLDVSLPTQGFRDMCDVVKEDDVQMEFFGSIVKVTIPNGFIAIRTLSHAYPKIEKIIPQSFECKLPVKTAEFNNALCLIDIIAHDGTAYIKYQPNKCTISNKAGFNTSIKTDLADVDIMLKINRELFKRAFKLLAKANLNLLYSGYKKPLILKEDNTLLILSVLEQK